MSHGTLAENVRAELAAISPTQRCDRLAEISGLFHTAGSLHLRGRGRLAFHLDLASNAVARRAFALLRSVRIDSEIRTYRRRAFDLATRYQLHLDGLVTTIDALVEAGVLGAEHTLLERPPGRVVAKGCCRGAYLRGAFLGGGSLTGPRDPQLELRTPTHAGAGFLRSVAGVEELRLRVRRRSDHSLAYAKSWDAIERFLAAAGAAEAVLDLEERAVVAELRAQANRLANADHANLVRQSQAAEAQIEAIHRLRLRRELERLPFPLSEAAELRLRYPTLSLRELAVRADPPTTKAGMQRRLGRLLDISQD